MVEFLEVRGRLVAERRVEAAGVVEATASLLAIAGTPVVAVGAIIVAAALTTLRDVLRLPDRLSDARYILMGTNREYDGMRLLWDTEGIYRPPEEYESFRRTSRLHDFANEVVNEPLLKDAQEKSKKYHKELTALLEARS